MADYLSTIASQLGISLWLLVFIFLWEAVWKLVAMWKAAAIKKSLVWFIVLAVFNTIGILPILYIFVFSKMGKKK
jgi:hypothetical protein